MHKASCLCWQTAKALRPGLWGAWPALALHTPGMTAWLHAKHQICLALTAPEHGPRCYLCMSLRVNTFHNREVGSWEQTEPCADAFFMTSPSPFKTSPPKGAALRRLLWKDIIILPSPSLSLFPASAPHCMVISSHRSLLNLVWKLSRAMRHHYLFCKVPFRAVAE